MVNGIPDQMGERIVNCLYNGFIKLNILADNGQIHLFVKHFGEISDHPREFIKDIADGLHSGQHYRFLKLGCYQVYSLTNCFCVTNII